MCLEKINDRITIYYCEYICDDFINNNEKLQELVSDIYKYKSKIFTNVKIQTDLVIKLYELEHTVNIVEYQLFKKEYDTLQKLINVNVFEYLNTQELFIKNRIIFLSRELSIGFYINDKVMLLKQCEVLNEYIYLMNKITNINGIGKYIEMFYNQSEYIKKYIILLE